VEEYTLIPNYETLYKINNDGTKIISLRTNKTLVHTVDAEGYHTVRIGDINKKYKSIYVHQLVAQTFLKKPESTKKLVIDHVDGVKENNHKDNLRWITYSENTKNAIKNNVNMTHVKPVVRIDKDGVRTEYFSRNEASKVNNINASNIGTCIKNPNLSAGGYKWELLEKHVKYTVILKKDEVFVNLGKFMKQFINYEVSNYGNIRNIKRNIFMSPSLKKGYYVVGLSDIKSKSYVLYVQRLVASCFVKVTDKYKDIENLVVNHKDENKLNNHYNNLEWMTGADNVKYSRGSKVNQIDNKTGKIINTFDSVRDAMKSCNKKGWMPYITECCNGKRDLVYGYKWEFA
jgi:hypothetical protein